MSRTWIKLHVEALDNPKVVSLTMAERGFWMMALLVAERYDRDGALPDPDRFALMAHYDPEQCAKAYAALVAKGFLDLNDGNYVVHDWGTWQEVEWYNTREAWRDRKRLQRERERMSLDVTRDTEGDVTRDIVTDVTSRDMSQVTVKNRLEKEQNREREETNGETPPKGGARGARIPARWPLPDQVPAMIEYGRDLGVPQDAVIAHFAEFHDYWSQSTKNATSMDWTKRWRIRFAQDVREDKIVKFMKNGARPGAVYGAARPRMTKGVNLDG